MGGATTIPPSGGTLDTENLQLVEPDESRREESIAYLEEYGVIGEP
jgi:hypothetical protein